MKMEAERSFYTSVNIYIRLYGVISNVILSEEVDFEEQLDYS
jgi:hypothetical protein